MLYYRLYFMDRFSGHIDHFREFEAEDDSAAIDMAAGWAQRRAMELWNRHRKLKHWDEPLAAPINDQQNNSLTAANGRFTAGATP